MSAFKAKVSLEDKDGNVIDPTQVEGTADGGKQFWVIKPGWSIGVIKQLLKNDKTGERVNRYFAGWKPFKNPETADGKFEYVSVSPEIELFNDNRTQISRTPIGLFAVNKAGEPHNPSGKNAIFGVGLSFLKAVGAFPNATELEFDPEKVRDVVVDVRTSIGAYVKAYKNEEGRSVPGRAFNSAEFVVEMTKANGGATPTFEEYAALVKKWNIANGYLNEDGSEVRAGVLLKMKNTIEAVSSVFAYGRTIADVEEMGYFVDTRTKTVYLSEASFDRAQLLGGDTDDGFGGDDEGFSSGSDDDDGFA